MPFPIHAQRDREKTLGRTSRCPLAQLALLLLITLAFATAAPSILRAQEKKTPSPTDSRPTLFIVGDSTVKNGTKGQMGWGDPIAEHFDQKRLRVENRARGGRSSRTFQTEGLWDRVLADAKPGDFVLIQMGHNDGGPLDDPARARGTLRGTGEETREIDNPITKQKETVHTYGWYLRKYIADARAKGMTPILCSPVPRCPQRPVDLATYRPVGHVAWSAEVAKSENVPFIDLHRLVLSRYVGMTPDQIKAKYFVPVDNTHTNAAGAALNAACVVEGLQALKDSPLAGYLQAADR